MLICELKKHVSYIEIPFLIIILKILMDCLLYKCTYNIVTMLTILKFKKK